MLCCHSRGGQLQVARGESGRQGDDDAHQPDEQQRPEVGGAGGPGCQRVYNNTVSLQRQPEQREHGQAAHRPTLNPQH